MIQQQGVCNSSLVLHKSLNLLVSLSRFGNYVRLTKQPLNLKHCFFFFKAKIDLDCIANDMLDLAPTPLFILGSSPWKVA